MNKNDNLSHKPGTGATSLLVVLFLAAFIGLSTVGWIVFRGSVPQRIQPVQSKLDYSPRQQIDTSGYVIASRYAVPWEPDATLPEISDEFQRLGHRAIARIDEDLETPNTRDGQRASLLATKASLLNYLGEARNAYDILGEVRSLVESRPDLARDGLFSIIAFQGVTALRCGENENCIQCRGESSCILPISTAARHINPDGSRRAIQHFTEYLHQFPDDVEIRWLLNLAHMTLGEYPDRVDPRYLVSLDRFMNSEFDIGKFRDIGHKVGVNSFNQAGGAIMEDFDNDGLLDLARTTFDPIGQMLIYRNDGKGHFEERSKLANVVDQLGGLNCMQTDYNNDGYADIFIVRGAWLSSSVRPSLLRNNKDGSFTDVTREADLLVPANSITASWADYDNDGWLDVFICSERHPSRLHRNLGNGKFQDVSVESGIDRQLPGGKGVAWIDYDNDGHQDLFVNYLLPNHGPLLFHNKGDGTFQDVTKEMGIEGPVQGFSCWAFDYDNDGWQDIFATCYERSLEAVVLSMQGKPHGLDHTRLYRNCHGKGFEDVSQKVGLDKVFATMGSNFADFDNDGYLDIYLGTGEPELETLVPNRMFRNVDGTRFAEITASSGTGNLQKGHGVACGDWDRDGNVDIFIEMGGAIPGDMYHNILFQNPGHDNRWITLKLIGDESNRAAIGARIKIVLEGEQPQTIHRHISSGSSFGANPLQQTIGLGKTERISSLEIHWPKTNKTQVFRDVSSNQAIEITESAPDYRKLNWEPVPVPAS